MISFIKGSIYDIKEDSVVLECNGIGYKILCPLADISKLAGKKDQQILLHTYLIHKEDSMTLYGFLSEDTKKGFLLLLKVGGIGPKAAVKILSHLNTDELYKCIENEDLNSLKNIPGIGPKMAKKIIFDLKGVIPHFDDELNTEYGKIENDLISAMINLGYKEADIRQKIKELKPVSDNFEIEFKKLLKKLAR